MKKIFIFVLICLALSGQLQAALAAAFVLGIWAAVFWVFKKIGILSAPTRISNAAGNEVRKAYNRSVLRDAIRRSLRR